MGNFALSYHFIFIIQEDTTFNPTIDTINVKIKKSLPKLTGS